MNKWDISFLVVTGCFLVFILLTGFYGMGQRSHDRAVCENLEGVYVSSTCFYPDAILDYEGINSGE